MNWRNFLSLTSFLAAITLFGGVAHAQATRTWVSGVGDDVNPCSRTAPCKTFAGAISKTAAGGEINCLDPGGFGAITITKSITIDCTGTMGSILASGTTGVIVNDSLTATPNTARVILRGLSINGGTPALPGFNGVRFIAGAQLTIVDSIIFNFTANNANGVSFQPQGAARLVIENTTIINNGTGATGGGILVQPTGASGSARVELDHVNILNHPNASIRVDTTGNTAPGGIQMTVRNSQLNNATNGVTVITPAATTIAQVNIFDSEIFNNQPGSGLVVNGANALIRASGNVIMGNGAALSILGGGSIRSYGDNITDGNSNPSNFTAPTLTKT